jgi:hypothetical protein
VGDDVPDDARLGVEVGVGHGQTDADDLAPRDLGLSEPEVFQDVGGTLSEHLDPALCCYMRNGIIGTPMLAGGVLGEQVAHLDHVETGRGRLS